MCLNLDKLMDENRFVGPPPTPPYGTRGSLKIVSEGPEYTARGTLKIKPESGAAENAETAAEVMVERDLEQAKAELNETEAAIGQAAQAGAAPEEVAALENQAKQAAAEIRHAQAELQGQGHDQRKAVDEGEDFSRYDSMEVGALESEHKNIEAEYNQAMAEVKEAVAAGATRAKANWLRAKAKRIGMRLAYVAHKLEWDHSKEEYAPKAPNQEDLADAAEQCVYELNDAFERHAEEFRSGKDLRDVVSESEWLRFRQQRETLDSLKSDPALSLEVAGKVKLDEMAADMAAEATTELELDMPGQGRKRFEEFLKTRSFSPQAMAERLTWFDNGLEYARNRRGERRMAESMAKDDYAEAARLCVSNPALEKTFFYPGGKYFGELLVAKTKELLDVSLESGIALYRQLPEGAPNLRQLQNLLYQKAEKDASDTVDFEERRHRIKLALAHAPEALVDQASGIYTRHAWNAEERFELLSSIVERNGHLSAAARFDVNDFPESMHEGVRKMLFGAYKQQEPQKIIQNAGFFKDDYAALPQREQARIKAAFLDDSHRHLGYLYHRLQYVPLNAEEFAKFEQGMGRSGDALIATLMKDNPVALLAGNNAEHFPLDAEQQAEIFNQALQERPFTLLENLDSLMLTEDQALRLKDKLLDTFADRLNRGRDQIEKLFGAHKLKAPEVLSRMRSNVDLVLALSRIWTNKHDLMGMVMDGGPEKIDAFRQAYAAIREVPISESMAADWIGQAFASEDPVATAKNFASRVREITDREPFAFTMVNDKAPAMAKKLLEGTSEERQNFMQRYKQAREFAGYLFQKLASTSFEKIFGYDEKRALAFLSVFKKIVNSPSQEIQKMSEQLADQVSASEDPEGTYAKVEAIFLRNNLPSVGKVFKVFELLHPQKTLDAKLSQTNLSPTLRAERHRGRMLTIYKDLLHAHIDSGNPSLKQYIEILQQGEGIMAQADEKGVEHLDEGQKKTLRSFLNKVKLLYENSLLGRAQGGETASSEDLKQEYEAWRENLGVTPDQSVNQRLAEMFLRPLGYENMQQVLDRMDEAKAEAGTRNAQLAASGQLELHEGDLFKGVNDRYLRHIMQNGSVAKEFLGASSDSDATPLDTDMGRVTAEDGALGFAQAFQLMPAKEYGEVALLVRNRGQFQETSSSSDLEELRKKARDRKPVLEIFHSGTVDQARHYGIRTGFPMTEVDALIVGDKITADTRAFDSMCMDVVQNGFYIPVADRSGKILFTPEDYQRYLEKYNAGLERLGGKAFELQQPNFEVSPGHVKELDKIKQGQVAERESIAEISRDINRRIFQALAEAGIETYGGDQDIVVRPELVDTGSTGRGTNVPGAYDFDLVLKLNPKDMSKAVNIQNAIMKSFDGTDNGSHEGQLRLKDGKLPNGQQNLEIDVAFVSKSDLAVYESHDAVKERLDGMDEATRSEVQANIVLAKKIFKEAGAYKKLEKGLGGLGVENFILQNGGNVLVAFKNFHDSAFKGGALMPFGEFKQNFKIIDPGLNAKFKNHDNFIEQNVDESGYAKIAQTIDDYLKKTSPAALKETA